MSAPAVLQWSQVEVASRERTQGRSRGDLYEERGTALMAYCLVIGSCCVMLVFIVYFD